MFQGDLFDPFRHITWNPNDPDFEWSLGLHSEGSTPKYPLILIEDKQVRGIQRKPTIPFVQNHLGCTQNLVNNGEKTYQPLTSTGVLAGFFPSTVVPAASAVHRRLFQDKRYEVERQKARILTDRKKQKGE